MSQLRATGIFALVGYRYQLLLSLWADLRLRCLVLAYLASLARAIADGAHVTGAGEPRCYLG
jgi:hypothetical protein